MKIIQFPLLKGQFIEIETQKRQIVLHNTASNYSAMNVVGGWNSTPERVAVPYIVAGNPINKPKWDISEDGAIFQTYQHKYWAWHIGRTRGGVHTLNQNSIGVEICNWDYLNKSNNGIITSYTGQVIPQGEVVEIAPFKGKRFFEVYTDAQLESVKFLIDIICEEYDIPKTFNGKKSGITAKDFEISNIALKGEKGIFAHSNYRIDKWDINPQPKMLYLLNNL